MKLWLTLIGTLTIFSSAFAKDKPQKILIVASSTDKLHLQNGKKVDTGYYLSELVTPALSFIQAGYEIEIVTPKGNKPVMDKNSEDPKFFDNDATKLQEAKNFVEEHPSMKHVGTLQDASRHPGAYAAVFVPGGHAPMNDLMKNGYLGVILEAFHKDKKPTAFLCHGPIATLAAVYDPAKFRKAIIKGDDKAALNASKHWIYEGYNMTVFSNAEERVAEENLGGKVPFLSQDALQKAGAKVQVGPAFAPFLVQDRELITGQNPASDHLVIDAVLKALREVHST